MISSTWPDTNQGSDSLPQSYFILSMDSSSNDRHILDWDESDVQSWFSSLGYPQYERQIRGFVLAVSALPVVLIPIKSTGS